MRSRLFHLAALLTAASLAGYGCGAGGGAASDAAPISDGAPTQDAAKTADVTFKVSFPKKDGVSAARLDDLAASVTVSWSGPGGGGSLELTPANPAQTVQLVPGDTWFSATEFDANGTILDRANTAGTILVGSNTVVLTFLQGQWTFVAADGATPEPITLAQGLTLEGFFAVPTQQFPGPMAFDPTKPDAGTDYNLQWLLPGQAPLAGGYLWHDSQFLGGPGLDKNLSAVNTMFYNLTTGMPADGPMGAPGETLFGIVGDGPKGGLNATDPSGNPVDVDQYLDSTVQNGTTLAGHMLEMTFESGSSIPTDPPTGICQDLYDGYNIGPAAALKSALSGPRAAGTDLGAITLSFKDCSWQEEPFTDLNSNGWWDMGEPFTDLDGNGYWSGYDVETDNVWTYSKIVVHPFTAKGSQLPATAGEIVIQRQ